MKKRSKVIIFSVVLIIILGLFILELVLANNMLKKKGLSYNKVSNLNFITHLKDNNYYDTNYLKNEYNIVASLVDYFNIDYNYSYTLDDKIDYILRYSIDADLEIYDSENEEKPVEKRHYTIKERETITGNSQVIKVDMLGNQILYSTYNQIVDEWKKEISPVANLKISINVDWKGTNDRLKKDISDKCVTEIVIPLSQKTIDIKIPNNIDEKGIIKSDLKLSSGYIILITSTILLFITGMICLLIYISNINKSKSKYEQKVNRMLREFDRAITEAKGKFTKNEGENYIEVENFMELLDVHDNVNEPIIYYKNSDDLSIFVIKNGKDNYYSQIKRSDYDD